MSSEEKLIDFSAEREKRIHDIKEKRLVEMRQAFEQVLPLNKPKKKPKTKPKKRCQRLLITRSKLLATTDRVAAVP